jgi:hypothetical protein
MPLQQFNDELRSLSFVFGQLLIEVNGAAEGNSWVGHSLQVSGVRYQVSGGGMRKMRRVGVQRENDGVMERSFELIANS